MRPGSDRLAESGAVASPPPNLVKDSITVQLSVTEVCQSPPDDAGDQRTNVANAGAGTASGSPVSPSTHAQICPPRDASTIKWAPSAGESPAGPAPDTSDKAAVSKSAIARRRGHCKSRLGCYSCKRRRVKCNELRPCCAPCKRLGLKCEYPTAANVSPRGAGPGMELQTYRNSSSSPQPAPSVLQLEDLRFFHQFMRVAYPALPLRGEAVWNEFAAMSYQYEHLAHALLGLGASHLSQNAQMECQSQALHHRVIAIKLVNEQLNCIPTKTVDADALLATIICLVAQSSLMPDSMIEYITMTRGANLVSVTIPNKENSLFGPMSTEQHIRLLREMVTEQPKDLEQIDDFLRSVLNLQPLCQTPCEVRYWHCMITSVNALRISASAAWEEFVTLFLMPAFFTNDEFNAFVAPTNYIGRLLIIHMFLFDYMAGRMSFDPSGGPKTAGRKFIIISWTRKVVDHLPSEYQQYMAWPLHFCDLLTTYDDARYLFTP